MSGTETELVFWSMSKAELLEAGDYIRDLLTTFQRTNRIGAFATAATDGPRKLLDAMQMAWVREVERRYGVKPWEFPEPFGDHAFAGLLELYEQIALSNPDTEMRRPPARERGAYRTCESCHVRYPLDEGHWSPVRIEGEDAGLSVICKGCEAADDYRQERERDNAAAQVEAGIWDQDAVTGTAAA